MFDVFAPVPVAVRRQRLEEYEQYLLERDGEMDTLKLTLAHRERDMARFESPPNRPREMDAGEFKRHYVSFEKRQPPDPEMTLLLALVKVNAAEAYGVTKSIGKAHQAALQTGDRLELSILCEELYHTRILLSCANLYGLQIEEAYEPKSALRLMIGGIANLPKTFARSLALAGELVGTVLFLKLLDVSQEVLKDAPEVRDAVQERLIEVCIDEIGHITYNRMSMGPAGLAQTRLILPMVTRTLSRAIPELVAANAFPHNMLEDLVLLSSPQRLPEAIRKHAFLA